MISSDVSSGAYLLTLTQLYNCVPLLTYIEQYISDYINEFTHVCMSFPYYVYRQIIKPQSTSTTSPTRGINSNEWLTPAWTYYGLL